MRKVAPASRTSALFVERVERNTDAEVEAAISRLAQDLARAAKGDGIVESHRDNIRTMLFAMAVIRARNVELVRQLKLARSEVAALSASAIEAGAAATVEQGAVHESAVPQGDAPNTAAQKDSPDV